jgi:hypothetical protein
MDALSVDKPKYSYTFKIDDNPAIGIAIQTAEPGEEVPILQRGFFYEGGSVFFLTTLSYTHVLYLKKWFDENGVDPSTQKNCLIQISPENEIHVDIEVPVIASIRHKQIPEGGIKKGDPITSGQIADIDEIEFLNVKIKKNWGIIFIFSVNGRRGIYFDFIPLDPNPNFQPNNLERSLATCFAFLIYPELLEIYPKIKNDLFKRGWFPFVRLLGPDFQKISIAIDKQSEIEETEQKIIQSFDKDRLLSIVNSWMQNPLFKTHEEILRHGVNKFIEGDDISTIHILYPRIEGILQYLYAKKCKKQPHVSDLREMLLIETQNKNKNSNLLLPFDFDEYLRIFYFKHFDVPKNKVDIGRHSVSHGVAQDFSKTAAFQAIMILDQLNYYI